MLSPRFGISASADALTLTGRAYVTGTQLLGIEDMDAPNKDGMWRYRIDVDGTGIEEYYEFPEKKSCSEVRDIWLDDVADNWGAGMAQRFKHKVKVTQLWQTKSETSSEGLALPSPQDKDSQ